MCDIAVGNDSKISRKRYIELFRLSEELCEWLRLHKVDYDKGECCVLRDLTLELLKKD